MPYASLKVSQEAKRELEILQAEMLTELGEKVTQHDLLARLIRLGRLEKARLLDWRPLTHEEWEEVAKLPIDTGDARGTDTIDEDVYGNAA